MTVPDDYNVVLVSFSGDIYAAVRVDINGYPTVYLNQNLAPEASRRAIAHEIEHFRAGHFFSHISIYDAEADAIRSERISVLFRARHDMSSNKKAEMCASMAPFLSELSMAYRLPDPERLATMRKMKRLTRAEVGQIVGADAETVRAWESGKASPDGQTKRNLYRLYGIGTS